VRADLRGHFRACLPYLSALYMENERLAEDLAQRYGLSSSDQAKLITLRRPWCVEADESAEQVATRARAAGSRILWAGDPDERAEASLRGAFARFGGDVTLDLWRTYQPFAHTGDAEAASILDFDGLLLTSSLEAAADVLLDAASAGVPLLHLGEGELGLGVQPQEIDVDALFTRDSLADPLAELSARAARRLRRLLGDEAERQAQVQRLKAYVSARHRADEFLSILTRDGGFLAPPTGRPETPR
jgi:hypothetical protein